MATRSPNRTSLSTETVDSLPLRRLLELAIAALGVLAGTLLDRVTTRGLSFDALFARRVRQGFERLGPTFVKVGQLISSSPGAFPRSLVDELAHCRDDVAPAPWEAVSRLIDAELGVRRRHLLEVDPTPFAAGSMAQVHAARLEDGTRVVVKVQRPNLRQVLAEDLRVLRLAARLATRFRPSLAAANPSALVEDFAQGLDQQLSFRTEIANLERMRLALGSLPVRVPRVWKALSSERVLVMERFEGVRVDDLAAIDALALDHASIVNTIAASLIVPAMSEGVFHGDLHAGNMLVLCDGTIGLFDFGVIGHLDRQVRPAIFELLAAVVSRRFDAVACALFRLVDTGQVDLSEIVPDLQGVISSCLDRPLGELDTAEAIGRVLEVAARHGLVLAEALVAFLKQIVYLDGICRTLEPSFDLLGDGAAIVELARADACRGCLPAARRAERRPRERARQAGVVPPRLSRLSA